MKIECDKCAAKYSIADEKVRGKTFKIRCKKCSNVIIVRDKAAAAPAADAHEDDGADEGALGWHLAINGETVGPLAEEDVRDRYAAGEIDKDTAIWQEGFEDWIPLGDVPVFDDLPDAPHGGGGYDGGGDAEDDPFASANQEDYAAGGVAAAASAAAVASHQPAAAAQQSPRVSSLTGQRNENSVLFSLDSLQQLATGGNATPAAAKPSAGANEQVGTKGLATAAPGSEGSGLIDIRALGAMVGNEQPMAGATPAAADDAALPSFGGSGLGGLAAAPLVATPSPEPAAAAAAAAPPPPARSNAPIYVLMVLLILALGGLAAYILLKPEDEPTVIVKEVPTAAPSVADKDDKEDDDKKDKDEDEEDKKDKDDKDDEDEEDTKGEDEAEAEADASKPSGSSSKKKRRSGSSGKKKSPSSDPLAGIGDPKPAKKPTGSKPSGGGGGDVSVDCILDPSSCKKGGSKKKPSGGSKPASDPNLPEKLSSSDIKAGVAPVKSAAKSCGGKHGASPGTKVQVKLSIQGSTGTVSSATAQAPHKGTPLGNCVAAALKKAKFKKFKKSSLGAVYPVRM